MAKLSEEEKKELLSLARSSSFKNDMRHVAENRHNPAVFEGRVDMDRLIEFLYDYNSFINHRRKKFEPMIEKVMKL